MDRKEVNVNASNHESAPNLEYRIAVSKDYYMLQGIPIMMIRFTLIIFGAGANIFAVLGTALSCMSSVGWYAKTYGKASLNPAQLKKMIITFLGLAITIGSVYAIERIFEDPLYWTSLAVGPLILWIYWNGLKHVGLTTWHWISCIGITFCSLLALPGLEIPRSVNFVFIGLALITIGIVDHHRLYKVFRNSAPQAMQ